MDTTLLDEAVVPAPAPEPEPAAPSPSTSPAWMKRSAALVAVALLSGGTAAVATHALDGRGATTVVGTDVANDLALLKIANVSGLPAATLGKSSDVRVGDDVVAIGNALALRGGPTVTRGIVSALDRSLETENSTMTGLIQTDAS